MSSLSPRLLLVIVLLLGALARLPGLGQEPFWTDEMHTIRQAGVRYAADQAEWQVSDLGQVTQGPLFMLLVHGWSRLWGNSEAVLRLVPALFGLLALPLIWSVASGRLGSRVGWFATLLLALSPFHVWYSRELRGYSMVILAVLAASWCFDRAVDPSRPRGRVTAWSAYVMAVLAGLWASFTMGFMFVVHSIDALARSYRSGWRFWVPLVAIVIMLTSAAAPWILVVVERFDLGRLVGQGSTAVIPLRSVANFQPVMIPYTFYALAAGFSLGPSLEALHAQPAAALIRSHWPTLVLVGGCFGGLALAGLIAIFRRRQWLTVLGLLGWIAVPMVLLAILAIADVKTWSPRYVAITLPPFLMLVAVGVDWLGGRRAWLLLALPLLIETVAVVNLHLDQDYWKEDYRSAGTYLEAHLDPADAMIGIGAPRPLFYYMQSRPASFTLLHPHLLTDPAELEARVIGPTAGAPRVWVCRARVWLTDPTDRVGTVLGGSRTRVAHEAYRGVEIECFE